ncbi:type III secretion protein SctD [Mycetohabitans sp. B2]|jgi:type III secretion protein D|uniref:type III secretion protein SctD n=1 Tax=Mycetohabitans sp. B2 TaxID=2841274 RepID=UPI001F3CED67|nr:type III secretion protein SctD [Mycetohabitans sp. B2]MCF7697522.1 type III secretion protein SctD [Mycetohabitans sp. B2]
MKLLRVLTGIHAGAQLKLAAGVYRLAADDDADIRLSDWSGAELVLSVDAQGAVRAQRCTAPLNGHDANATQVTDLSKHIDQNAQTPVQSVGPATVEASTSSDNQGYEPILLLDFVPMQFDDTVICIGPADSAWPSDVELLSTLLVKPDQDRREAKRARHRKIAGITLACTAVGMIIGLGTLLMSAQDSRAARRHDINDLAQHINRLLVEQKLTELHAQVSGSVIRVTGMVPTAAEDSNARDLLQRAAAGVALRQYDVAEVDARSIAESLGTPGVQVAYAGNGVFDVTAKVDDPQQFRQSLERVRRDLNKNVKTLRTHITAIDKNLLPSTYSELIESDAIQYAQAPDGTKHIYVAEQSYGQAVTPESNPPDNTTVSPDADPTRMTAQVTAPPPIQVGK